MTLLRPDENKSIDHRSAISPVKDHATNCVLDGVEDYPGVFMMKRPKLLDLGVPITVLDSVLCII